VAGEVSANGGGLVGGERTLEQHNSEKFFGAMTIVKRKMNNS
jgi:hypothetical protein